MKYDNYIFDMITNFLFLVITVVVLLKTFTTYINTYNVYDGVKVVDKVYAVFLNEKDVKALEQNHYVYTFERKEKISIVAVREGYDDYKQVLIKFRHNFKEEKIKVSMYDKKRTFFEIFFDCWED